MEEIYNDIVAATEMAMRDSGGCVAMRELLMSLCYADEVCLHYALAKLDSSNQRLFLRVLTAALSSTFNWDFFHARMKQVSKVAR